MSDSTDVHWLGSLFSFAEHISCSADCICFGKSPLFPAGGEQPCESVVFPSSLPDAGQGLLPFLPCRSFVTYHLWPMRQLLSLPALHLCYCYHSTFLLQTPCLLLLLQATVQLYLGQRRPVGCREGCPSIQNGACTLCIRIDLWRRNEQVLCFINSNFYPDDGLQR